MVASLVVAMGDISGWGALKLHWSGFTWTVRNSFSTTEGPGSNWWTDSASSVWVDDDAKLHLNLRMEGNKWLAAELDTDRTFKYGTFVWKIEGPTSPATGALDKNVVLRLFKYRNLDYNNEIAVELARFGNQEWPNLNYTVSPSIASLWDATQRVDYQKTYEMQLSGNYTTQMLEWRSSQVRFSSKHGDSGGATSIFDWKTPSAPLERVPHSA